MRLPPALYIVTLALTLILAGCASSAATAVVPPRQPAVLRWGLVGLSDVPTLDPALASDPISISIASLVYGGLVRLDSHLRVQPDGAQRWTISPDGTVYTFYLRHNLRFANGQHVTASDFAAAINRALGPEGAAGTASFYLSAIRPRTLLAKGRVRPSGITVLNAHTLRLTLSHPSGHFLAELAFPASYVPEPDLMQRYGAVWTDHAAGFGPFVVRSWSHSRSLTLVRNPYYYGGKPALRRITLHFYQQPPSALTAYQHGKLDLVSGFPPGHALTHAPTGTFRVAGLALDYLAFNTTRLPFFRLNARRALASGWPAHLLASATTQGDFPAHSFLPAAFDMPVALWQPRMSPRAYLARARMRASHFPHLALAVIDDPTVEAVGAALATTWRKTLGIDITVRPLNPSDYTQVLNHRAFDLAIVRWGADYPDPQDFLGTQLGASSQNATGWTNRHYDALLRQADAAAPTDPQRAALLAQAAKLAAHELPLVPLDEPAFTAVVSPALTGIQLTPLGTITGNWRHAGFRP